MSEYVKNLQNQICEELSKVDGKEFVRDSWTRKLGGEGISCVLQDGNVFEKAGVNISIVHGKLPLPAIKQMRANASEQLKGPGPYNFFTASLSLVLHPHNPFAPTVHLNYRYFEIINPENPENKVWWFGGGSDLTPSYLIEEDAEHFHKTLKNACDKHDPAFYTDFKKWCDKYFYNTHRSEARGIGGIFFDDLDSKDPEQLFKFVRECGDSFLPSYVPILKKRINTPFTKEQKEWQQMRRGRYVEFNLIHDRGTKFGLATPNPRIESILVSLPKTASWAYNHQPEPNSPEAKLVDVLKNPKEWV
jgi:coproporphyrinogen III oxidase